MTKWLSLSIIIMYLVSSCKKENEVVGTYMPSPIAPTTPADSAVPKTFLALGDSYTIGQSVAESDRFAVQAVKLLTADNIKFAAPEIIAQTGWTTANLLSTLQFAAPLKPQYDIVTLLIGVNNQYQRRTQQEYADQFLILLSKSVMYAGNNKDRVIVLSIPDYSVTPFASGSDKALIAKEIDSFNVINKTIATKAGVNYLDITGSSRQAAANASLIATDGLHPSGLQYKLWADSLIPIIKAALK